MKKWLKKTGIKTLKTMAETAMSLIGTNAVGLTDINWVGLGSAVLLSGIVTILFNIQNIEE